MQSKLKILIIVSIALFVTYKIVSFFSTFHFYAAGRYPYAETYYLKYPENEVLMALEKLQLKNADLKDKYSKDYWHDISFDLNGKRIEAWTRPFEETTDFALVAVYKDRESEWQLVNQDLGLLGNIMLKREFEKEVIEKLKMELAKQHQ
ncbi:hypothetical protein [Flavobacterium foetidum]|uniref:hypothetical protein n=1 Tax=Flavobacterium foetidum TaxID=2026681 RepID=UPI001074A144|nr:hypothetical protein [Flavobacterium foetidum]KAF2516459.1 hypothetical protein E0W73_05040 [Flavobacterium foetidum]